MRMSPKGYPSQDLCIIPADGCRNRFGGRGKETEAKRGGVGGVGYRSEIANYAPTT